MATIDIPFNDWSQERLNNNTKTATTRNKKYGDPGDRFTVDGRIYELTHVNMIPLSHVAYEWYEQEGADSQSEFVDVWEDIHPRKGFQPNWRVWLHLFREVE